MLLFLLFTVVIFQLEAQEITSLWTKKSPAKSGPYKLEKKNLSTNDYHIFQLNLQALRQVLSNTETTSRNSDKSTIVPIPTSNGQIHQFQVRKSNTLHPILAQKYPSIQTFEGIGQENSNMLIRLEITPKGLFGMIWDEKGSQIIEPTIEEQNEYVAFSKKTLQSDELKHFSCQFDEIEQYRQPQTNATSRNSDSKLRTFRLALACTGEYAQFHGGTKELALAAIATTVNRVNGIFKKEVAVELQLIPDNDLIIFTNEDTDPFTNNDGSEMLGENQNTCDSLIGSPNYDIGHVFSTDGGGVAYLGSVCFDPIKAGGVTGQQTPEGDPFDVDFVAHEIGTPVWSYTHSK